MSNEIEFDGPRQLLPNFPATEGTIIALWIALDFLEKADEVWAADQPYESHSHLDLIRSTRFQVKVAVDLLESDAGEFSAKSLTMMRRLLEVLKWRSPSSWAANALESKMRNREFIRKYTPAKRQGILSCV